MNIEPLQDYFLLEVKEYDDANNIGIVIPQKYRKKIPRGTILKKGKYCTEDFDVGETVLFQKSGTKALPNDLVLCPEYRILPLKEI